MYCDLCGKETNKLYKITLENTVVFVCEACRSFGKTLGKVDAGRKKPAQIIAEKSAEKIPVSDQTYEITENLIDGYGGIIRAAREKKNLPPKDFAKVLGIKESLLLKIESSHYEPTIKIAKKIERLLSVRLIDEIKSPKPSERKSNETEPTLGDFVKIKKRKSQNF